VQSAAQAGAKAAASTIGKALVDESNSLQDVVDLGTAAAKTAIQTAAPGLSKAVIDSMAQTCAKAAAGVFANAGTTADAITAAATAAVAGGKTAVTVLNGVAQLASSAAQIGGGVEKLSEAQINYQIAELGADVQDLTARFKLLQTELTSQQDVSKNVEDELKDVMTLAQSIMQKLFSAMNSQSDIVQTVGAFGKKG
jgi:X-X-X-Leu-X-X-Gly heptad repeat protein